MEAENWQGRGVGGGGLVCEGAARVDDAGESLK